MKGWKGGCCETTWHERKYKKLYNPGSHVHQLHQKADHRHTQHFKEDALPNFDQGGSPALHQASEPWTAQAVLSSVLLVL